MNFITDLPLSKHKYCVYDAILVVVNRYTKMIVYIPTIKKINAVDLNNEDNEVLTNIKSTLDA